MTAIRDRFAAAADPTRAPAMQAYMKSVMPFRGIPTPQLRKLCGEAWAGLAYPDEAAWRADVLALWREAAFREERYAAIELAGHRAARRFQRFAALPVYRELIVSGAWWDYIDPIASHRLLALLKADPIPMRAAVLDWSSADDRWLRRAAILCQLLAKGSTDTDLLARCIAPSLGAPDFFLRKAIGWALRAYSRTDPDWVRRYVADHADRLSPLSTREALKHLRPT